MMMTTTMMINENCSKHSPTTLIIWIFGCGAHTHTCLSDLRTGRGVGARGPCHEVCCVNLHLFRDSECLVSRPPDTGRGSASSPHPPSAGLLRVAESRCASTAGRPVHPAHTNSDRCFKGPGSPHRHLWGTSGAFATFIQ
jgi:hypothetical protein